MEMSQELQRMKTNHKLQEQHWANKEYDYKKRIQQLETKVCTLVMELFFLHKIIELLPSMISYTPSRVEFLTVIKY